MEFNAIQGIEDATRFGRKEMFRLGIALLFIFTVRGVMLPRVML